ncbi:hypothetical protein [Delftia tsuruhatensis]|uniref:hypothetical protein n=1 Tax=Delftia tsuruhatensis TaxID=180282 RepID=UPI001F1D8AB2|nr:hypothetical protein [Delftia tsuruhatensis]
MQNRLNCPNCHLQYRKLLYKEISICPYCNAKIKTDIFIINLIESTAGAPVLWMFSSLFRLWLGDDLELLAYALTISIAAAMHWVVVNHYITAMVVGEE